MTRQALQLLIVDPQNDFCDLPAAYCPIDPSGGIFAPALPVPGAHADMQRLAHLIDAGREALDAITITLDSHHHLDIAHPTFWRQANGEAVAPFTSITAADLRAGRYLPRAGQARERAQVYLDALESQGRYTHMIWPVHCEIGTWGHNIHHDLRRAYNRWEKRKGTSVNFVVKGENPWTEHYSAMMAEVPVADDPRSQFNEKLLAFLREADRVYIAGEAGSHCVKATTEHIVARWPAAELTKLALVEDCVSPVAGFESQYAEFLSTLRAHGIRIISAAQAEAELRENMQNSYRQPPQQTTSRLFGSANDK